MDLVRTEMLSKSYGAFRALSDLDLSVPEGSLFGFLGPNGAGKSTTIRLLMGLLQPSAGRASLLGCDAWSEGARARVEVGYLPGELRLAKWMSVRAALQIFGRVRGRALKEPGLALAERLGLDPDVEARRMSSGMRQKLGLVMALAHDPRLLVLDEPSNGLDPLVQLELETILRERAASGTTVFFSSHTLSEVEDLCERVAILRGGRLVSDASLEDLRREAPRQVTLRFSGTAALEAPTFLSLEHRSEKLWRGELCGSVRELVRWAANQEIEDLSLGEPDLESLFRRHYRDAEDFS